MKVDFLKQMQSFVAESATGPSALRNQGLSGLILWSNEYFKGIPLGAIPGGEPQYAEWLDGHTERLRMLWLARTKCEEREKLVAEKPLFGASRKALNLFLRSAAYNRYLGEAYAMDRLLPLMEVPLDSFVAEWLRVDAPAGEQLPSWPGLKWLKSEQHAEYQSAARILAIELGVCRVDLDAYYYRVSPPVRPKGTRVKVEAGL